MPKTKETSRMRKINEKYDEFSNMTEEQMNDKLEKLNKEIEGTKKAIENIPDVNKRAEMKDKLHGLEKERKLANGFKNNKTKIDKARTYKAKVEETIAPLQARKNDIENRLKKIDSEMKKIDKKLNVKDPSAITNEQYNAMQSAKATFGKEQSTLKAELEKVEKQIEAKQMSISKCNMIYSNLMYNETWDKINLKACRMSYQAKNNKKEQEKEEKIEEVVEAEEKSADDRDVWSSEEARLAYLEEQTKLQEKARKKENSLIIRNAFKENHPRIAKMMDFFSKAGNKIKNVFKKKEEPEKQEELVEEVIEEKPQEMDFAGKRDAFVEMFRKAPEVQMSDKGKESLKEIRKTSNELAGKGHKDDEER